MKIQIKMNKFNLIKKFRTSKGTIHLLCREELWSKSLKKRWKRLTNMKRLKFDHKLRLKGRSKKIKRQFSCRQDLTHIQLIFSEKSPMKINLKILKFIVALHQYQEAQLKVMSTKLCTLIPACIGSLMSRNLHKH